MVERAREAGVADIIDRCNLTVLLEPGQEDLVAFLARHRVRIAASLPCYSAANVDEQRGGGVFERSIRVGRPLPPMEKRVKGTKYWTAGRWQL